MEKIKAVKLLNVIYSLLFMRFDGTCSKLGRMAKIQNYRDGLLNNKVSFN